MTTNTSTAAANAAPAAPAVAKPRKRDAFRDNGLATLAILLVVAVAVAGWSASFISLHEFALKHMGLSENPAWLVPSTFDGAALGLSLLSFRAAIYGRASLGSMLYVYGFTALSSWINWVHIDDKAGGKFVSALLPIAAVIVFGKVLKEAREAYERRHGKQVFKVRPGLLMLRWMADRTGTRKAIRTQILEIPVQALIGLGAGALAREANEAIESTTRPADTAADEPVAVPEVHRRKLVNGLYADAAVNPAVNPAPVPQPVAAAGPDAAGFAHLDFPHQINRAESLVNGSLGDFAETDVEDGPDANPGANPAETGEEESGTAEVHTSEADKGRRVDSKTSQSLILAGWFNGESARSIADRTGRTTRYIYQQFNALDAKHGPRPRKDDTGEFPAITAANGFAVDR